MLVHIFLTFNFLIARLKDAVDKINELLEELKYESEDLYIENEEDTEIPVER